jgi:spore coat protein U-like protein
MKIRRALLVALLATMITSAKANAQCQLSLEVNNVEWRQGRSGGYDLFDPIEYTQSVPLRVRHGGDACNFFITFSGGGSIDFNRRLLSGRDTLSYQLYDTANKSNVLKDLPTATAAEVITGSFGQGDEGREFRYIVVFPPLQIRSPGLYRDSLQVTLYEGAVGNSTRKDSKYFTVTARIQPMVELSVVDSGAPFNPQAGSKVVDFGSLMQGQSRRFDLRIRGNAGYRVTFQSENGGVMKHTDPTDSSAIPYVLDAGGAIVNLDRGQHGFGGEKSGITGLNGDRLGLTITVGPVAEATAGTYRDTITVTVVTGP